MDNLEAASDLTGRRRINQHAQPTRQVEAVCSRANINAVCPSFIVLLHAHGASCSQSGVSESREQLAAFDPGEDEKDQRWDERMKGVVIEN
ncbi:hypothetical protein QBC99_000140 [Beijerinckia sp. GAS462]|nr:hypothetical protein [Beijerinckia sp. GAS462]SEB52803.1 hypothetical protein SAMN05443249_0343 [Beijerinckia sp. 28-YEA-48]